VTGEGHKLLLTWSLTLATFTRDFKRWQNASLHKFAFASNTLKHMRIIWRQPKMESSGENCNNNNNNWQLS